MTSASASSNSAQPSSSLSWKYDVFISFRGEDTRKTFVDHLYSALVERLIRVYKDDQALPRGDIVGPSLSKAIEESHIAVIVFSKNYAESLWCLDELANIMKCREERGLTVMPIFYDVNPSEMRNQKSKFAKAVARQEAKNFMKADLWRKALTEASNIAGWEPRHIVNGYESRVIKEIVDKIQDRLFPLDSNIDEELVGMRFRLQHLISRLEIGSGGVRMVGIWGMGGSGKTTLAYSVYTEISRHFRGHCIVANIREASSKHGLETLQQKILSTILKTEVKVQSVEEGKFMIKSRLRNSKVLVILDDVDDLDQLQALAGSHKWFGSGSRIIITTRDEHVLTAHRVDHISPVKLLSNEEAILLLHKHAYNEKKPLKDYETLSLRVLVYAGGLPLAIKVLGSFLFDKDENEWISALAMLKDFPNIKIMDILRISYDGLEPLQKELFLDIACFFRGESADIRDEPMEILDACGFHPVIGIKVLQQRALVSIVGGKFDMHDLVQDLGHYLVRGQHPNNPEKHSRVWKEVEIDNMHLRDATKENHEIEAVHCHGHLSYFGTIVSNMKKLRLLSYTDVDKYDDKDTTYAEVPNFLSNELRYFFWINYPASPLPNSFQPLKLRVLKMSASMQKELWNGYKHLPHLKVLKLFYMGNLLSTPDFGGLPCLQKLELINCGNLKDIHPSLGNHRSLENVCVSFCDKLRIFPTIVRMEKLNTLEISYCDLVELPEIQANFENLAVLTLGSSGKHYTQVDTMFYPLTHTVQKLNFNESVFCPLTHFVQKLNFMSLRKLNLSGWGLKDEEIPSDIGELSNLEELDLSGNDFSRLYFSLSHFTQLRLLCLTSCKRLVELPELPSSLAILEADGCHSLTSIGNCHRNCKRLREVSLVNAGFITDGSKLLQSMLEGSDIDNHCMIIQLQGLDIPKRFLPCLVSGKTCRLQLPENWCNDFSGFIMCAACRIDFIPLDFTVIRMEQVMSSGLGMDSEYGDVAWKESADDRRTWVGFVSFALLKRTSWWDETYNALSFSFVDYYNKCSGFGWGLVPKKTGITSAETSTYSPAFSNYTPNFRISDDSASALRIILTTRSYRH